jgi:hypothetical protein
MTLWKRIKTLWWISGLDFGPQSTPLSGKQIEKFIRQLKGKKMAQIVETKDPEDLFPNQEQDERNTN